MYTYSPKIFETKTPSKDLEFGVCISQEIKCWAKQSRKIFELELWNEK